MDMITVPNHFGQDYRVGFCFGVVGVIYFSAGSIKNGKKSVFSVFPINTMGRRTTNSSGDDYGRRIFGFGEGVSNGKAGRF